MAWWTKELLEMQRQRSAQIRRLYVPATASPTGTGTIRRDILVGLEASRLLSDEPDAAFLRSLGIAL